MNKIKIGIVGASGYSGMDLMKLLVRHSKAEVSVITSGTYAGKSLSEVNPYFKGKIDLDFVKLDYNYLKENCDVVFFATPSGVAMEHAKHLYDSNLKLIDISGDFRLSSNEDYIKWYKREHQDEASLSKWVYGLTEVFRDRIADTKYLSNPGCYPTSILLALLPFYKLEKPKGSIICDAKSGVSGKGKKLMESSLYVECNENFLAYKVVGHQHTPEIEKAIKDFSGNDETIVFTPHLIPMDRGILSTIYINLKESNLDDTRVREHYQDFYSKAPFVKVLDKGQLPQTKSVSYTNECHIAMDYDERSGLLKIISVIDNLVKGAAGSALQNFNVMFGLDEETGLL